MIRPLLSLYTFSIILQPHVPDPEEEVVEIIEEKLELIVVPEPVSRSESSTPLQPSSLVRRPPSTWHSSSGSAPAPARNNHPEEEDYTVEDEATFEAVPRECEDGSDVVGGSEDWSAGNGTLSSSLWCNICQAAVFSSAQCHVELVSWALPSFACLSDRKFATFFSKSF